MVKSGIQHKKSTARGAAIGLVLLTLALPGCSRLASRSADGNMLARLKPSSSTAVASAKAVAEDPFPSAAQAGIAGAQ
jgi:hypothetical protein